MSAEEFARAEGVGLPDERSEELCEAKSQEAEPFSCPARRRFGSFRGRAKRAPSISEEVGRLGVSEV